MRRTAAVLLALAVVLLGTPALAAPEGTLVIVANGPAVGTVTLPATRLSFWEASYDTTSPYTAITVTQGTRYLGHAGLFPGNVRASSLYDVAKGRITVRVMTSGRTTITVPGTGFSGRRVVQLRSRLRGATATFAPAEVLAGTASNVLPFTTAARSHVFQGYDAGRPVADEEIFTFCLSSRGEACPEPASRFWRADSTGAHVTYDQAAGGARDSHLTLAATGVFLDPVTHYVITVPVE